MNIGTLVSTLIIIKLSISTFMLDISNNDGREELSWYKVIKFTVSNYTLDIIAFKYNVVGLGITFTNIKESWSIVQL